MNQRTSLKWRIVSKNIAFKCKWFRIVRHSVELPTGVVLPEYYTIGEKDVVAVLAINSTKEVLLVRQYRLAIDEVTVDIPGGGVNKGETSLQAAKRELIEETGLVAKNLKLIATYYPDSGKCSNRKYIYLGTDLTEKEPAERHYDLGEVIEVVWKPLASLQEAVDKNELMEATLRIALSAIEHHPQLKSR